MIKDYSTKDNPFNRNQRMFIAEKIRDSFSSDPLYKSLGTTLQSIGNETIRFNFETVTFPYKIETETTEDPITENKTVVEHYLFEYKYKLPGVEHVMTITQKIRREDLDGIK